MKLKSPYGMRLIIVGLWLLALLAILAIIGPGNALTRYSQVTPQGIRDRIAAFGALAVLVFLAVSAIRPFFFLPVTPFTMASGFLFGFWQGLLWSFVATTTCAVLTFALARYLLHDYVARRYAGRFPWLDQALEKRGWSYIAFLRLIPLLPFDIVSYAAGVSRVRFKDYVIGTVLGEAPGAVVLVLLGSSLDEIGSATFYISLLLAATVLLVPEVLRRWMKRYNWRPAQDND